MRPDQQFGLSYESRHDRLVREVRSLELSCIDYRRQFRATAKRLREKRKELAEEANREFGSDGKKQ